MNRTLYQLSYAAINAQKSMMIIKEVWRFVNLFFEYLSKLRPVTGIVCPQMPKKSGKA